MSLMNKLARKIARAQQSPGAVKTAASPITKPTPTATGGRPEVGTQQPTQPQPNTPAIGGLTGRGERHYIGNAPGTRPAKRPKGLRYGGRI